MTDDAAEDARTGDSYNHHPACQADHDEVAASVCIGCRQAHDQEVIAAAVRLSYANLRLLAEEDPEEESFVPQDDCRGDFHDWWACECLRETGCQLRREPDVALPPGTDRAAFLCNTKATIEQACPDIEVVYYSRSGRKYGSREIDLSTRPLTGCTLSCSEQHTYQIGCLLMSTPPDGPECPPGVHSMFDPCPGGCQDDCTCSSRAEVDGEVQHFDDCPAAEAEPAHVCETSRCWSECHPAPRVSIGGVDLDIVAAARRRVRQAEQSRAWAGGIDCGRGRCTWQIRGGDTYGMMRALNAHLAAEHTAKEEKRDGFWRRAWKWIDGGW